MEKLIIDRSKWRTGRDGPNKTGEGSTLLLNSEGYMCCLGFEALRLKFNEGDILGTGEPSEIEREIEQEETTSDMDKFIADTTFCKDAIDINDNESTSIEEKEDEIKSLFLRRNIEVIFK